MLKAISHKEASELGCAIIHDVESWFLRVELTIDDVARKLVSIIEGGQLLDHKRFIDRFGVTLYLSELSTGCKAALLVNSVDTFVDLIECGYNARDAIISFCDGNIVVETPQCQINDYSNGLPRSLYFDGHVFDSVASLNMHIETGGVEC